MRLRFGAALCLFFAFIAAGCRNGLDPGALTNQPPETWITAAPQDTITVKNPQGVVVGNPTLALIPVRFHIYWAGADKDGAVDHYLVAVTETTAVSLDGLPLPPLPGPVAGPVYPDTVYKAGAYHSTRRSDSLITFTASIDAPDRVHTFYVVAVDNKGVADPTPARFTFRAYDRNPPIAVMDEASGTGTVYLRSGSGVVPQTRTYAIHDSAVVSRSFPSDTVPSGSTLTFRWHGEPRTAGVPVAGYQYKLEEQNYNVVGPSVTVATYNTGVPPDTFHLQPGTKLFTLRTLDQSGWRSQLTRFFQMNFAPDEWFSGPDLNNLGANWQSYQDHGGTGKRYWYQDVSDWNSFLANGGLPGTLVSADSARILPADRPERRTFFEIYGNTIWAHQEGDTVSLNSWLVMPSGGSDIDSPYQVLADSLSPHPAGAVLTSAPPNGSPVGFAYRLTTRKPNGQLLSPTESATYPNFLANAILRTPRIICYAPMNVTGKAFFTTAAVDGDETIDRRITRAGGAAQIVEDVDGGGGTDLERAVRSKILLVYVNHKPYFQTGGTFSPTTGQSFQRGTSVVFQLPAGDLDPVDYNRDVTAVGGPQQNPPVPVLVRTVLVSGPTTAGRDTTIDVMSGPFEGFQNATFILPAIFAVGPAHVLLQVCDYRASDVAPGNAGRCSDVLDIPINITGPQPGLPTSVGEAVQTPSRPGITSTDGRRQQP